jgi:AmmeMemoRadiSam system protein A
MYLLLLFAAALLGGVISPPAWGGQGSMSLTETDKKALIQAARDSIRAHLKGATPPAPAQLPPIFREPRGVFVSLHRQGRLRGCIGYLEAVKPLYASVQEMAVAAAFHDPRFSPLRVDELTDLEVEISVLTPMRRIEKPEEIEAGKHGLYIERGPARGLLLPQVATQYNWDRTTFLEQTCAKAGLPTGAWKDPDTRLYVFTADIFSETPSPGAKQESTPR